MGEIQFDKIFNQRLGYLLFKDFCQNVFLEPVPQFKFYEDIRRYEKMDAPEDRKKKAREIYDTFIMRELLSNSNLYSKNSAEHVQKLLGVTAKSVVTSNSSLTAVAGVDAAESMSDGEPLPQNLFEPYLEEIFAYLGGGIFQKFVESDKFTRFCQWKNFELNIQLTLNDFSIHRLIGCGGFGEVYGCRKADTGKMYAMKCLDKKRIKMQHGVFNEAEMKFYAAEVILGLEHMHKRFIVYRDLKPANILLDELGHVRISDLGLACDFSKKKPHASVGTHGYMAPEVLSKGTAYDSSADWFSFGCMLYELLKGHSPFQQHKTKDKHDRMTLTMNVELPDTSIELRQLLEGLLQRDVDKRLGCKGELKNHAFFHDVDWNQVYQQKYPPP